VFVGVPSGLFVLLIVRHYWRLCRDRRRQWQEEADRVRAEGLAPGPPVESPEQTPE